LAAKGNPADLRELGNDIDRAIHDHADAIKHNEDIAAALFGVRNAIRERYNKITEGRCRATTVRIGSAGTEPQYFERNGDLIP